MLRIRYPKIKTTLDLKAALQNAIMLELGTIPPYLTAWWTLKKTSPGASIARGVLSGIWQDEMFHMLATCNLLNAIGGAPVLNDPKQAPQYPGPLPMTIGGDDGHPFNVSLRRYSKALVQDTFMVIEEPEDPVTIGVGPQALAVDIEDHYRTIGEFYIAVEAKIVEKGESLFANPHAKQVEYDPVTAIKDVASAQKALQRIRFQGEGVPKTPFTTVDGTAFAHFYRFQSLWKGMALKVVNGKPFFDPTQPIVVDEAADVIQMVDNPGQADLSQDPVAQQKAQDFDQQYKGLLNDLHNIVNGDPDSLDIAIGTTMPSLTDAAMELLNHQIVAGPQAGQFAGPRFLAT